MSPETANPARGLAAGLGISSSVGTSDGPENAARAAVAQAKNNRTVDFRWISQAAISSLPAILARIVPGGKIIGAEYVVRNPARADRRLGSFKINLRSGKWADFATGDKGGDPVSLVAFVEGVSQGEAARLLARMLGLKNWGRRHG